MLSVGTYARLVARAFWPAAGVGVTLWLTLYATCTNIVMPPGRWRDFFWWFDVAQWPIMGPSTNPPLMLGDSIMYIGILGVMSLVALNTAYASRILMKGYENESDLGVQLSPEQRKFRANCRRKRIFAARLLGITSLLIAIWFVSSVSGTFFKFGHDHWSWATPRQQQAGHERISVLVFAMCLLVDCLLLLAISREIQLWAPIANSKGVAGAVSRRIAALRSERRFQLDSILFIDVPVLVGVIAIIMMHSYLEEHRWRILAERSESGYKEALLPPSNLDLYLIEDEMDGRLPRVAGAKPAAVVRWPTNAEKISRERQVRRFDGFLQGMSTGAVMMHIAISQLIFGVLLFRLFARERTIESEGGD